MAPTILVPIDGSPFSERALPAAVSIARRTGGRVHLVRVHEPVIAALPFDALPAYDPAWDRDLRDREESHLRTLADRVEESAGAPTRAELVDGPIADALAEYAATAGADLIVMTTHGHGGFNRLWLGSVADGLVRRVSRPVLLLRPEDAAGAPLDPDAEPAFGHVLIPLDGSAASAEVVDQAIALGAPFGARYTLLRVVGPVFAPGRPGIEPGAPPPPELALEKTRAVEALETIAGAMRANGLDVTTAAISHGRPALGIIEYAERNGVDLIAMTTHGRGGWRRLTLGSVADKVLRGTSTPLLLYRAPVDAPPTPAEAGTAAAAAAQP